MNVCKVEFRKNTKKYFFNQGELVLNQGDKVVVETIRGVELGFISSTGHECPKELEADIKPVLRVATDFDVKLYEDNLAMKPSLFRDVKEQIIKNGLEMKLVDVEYTLDRMKLLVYFEADDRVDFRALVKDLAALFKTRIELRQIGPRDGAKALGGLGPCGLVMCCNSFIDEFDNVTIKMAKNQNLSLNPQKISGTCGKLLCCIKYENDLYEEFKEGLPDVGDVVRLEEYDAKVLSVNILKKEMRVKKLDDEVFSVVTLKDIKAILGKQK